MEIKIPVSIGELFDKISILEIKNERITSLDRLTHVKKELKILNDVLLENKISIPKEMYLELKTVNEKLWDIEDYIREKEEKKNFDAEFVKYARLDAHLNDQRFLVKNKINNHFDSEIKEQKSYKEEVMKAEFKE